MGKKSVQKARNMNFRETRSERSATAAYRNFHGQIKKFLLAVKFKKNKDQKI